PNTVMPALGPGIHELVTRSRGERGGQPPSPRLRVSACNLSCKLMDARAKPWHDEEGGRHLTYSSPRRKPGSISPRAQCEQWCADNGMKRRAMSVALAPTPTRHARPWAWHPRVLQGNAAGRQLVDARAKPWHDEEGGRRLTYSSPRRKPGSASPRAQY